MAAELRHWLWTLLHVQQTSHTLAGWLHMRLPISSQHTCLESCHGGTRCQAWTPGAGGYSVSAKMCHLRKGVGESCATFGIALADYTRQYIMISLDIRCLDIQ